MGMARGPAQGTEDLCRLRVCFDYGSFRLLRCDPVPIADVPREGCQRVMRLPNFARQIRHEVLPTSHTRHLDFRLTLV